MREQSAWRLTFACGLCLVVLVFAMHLADAPIRANYFSADHLYIATLFADVTQWNGKFSEWNLTPAPYFFPDMPLYAVVRSVTPSVEAAQFATDCLQLLLIVFAARALLRRALPDRRTESSAIFVFFALWFYLHLTLRLSAITPATTIAAHGGGLLATLVVFTLCLRPRRRRSWFGGVAVALISALTGASDALFVISCSLPLAATVLWYGALALRNRSDVRPPQPVLLGRCFVGAIAGVAGLWFARAYGFVHANLEGSISLALATWRHVMNDWDREARGTLFGLAIVALVAIGAVVQTWRDPRRAGLRVLSFWQLAVTGAAVGAFLYNGAYSDRSTLRYLVTPCNLALIYVAALCIRGFGSSPLAARPNPWPVRVAVVATFTLVCGVATQASALVSTRYGAPQRAAARCIAELAAREQIDAIIAEYWVAKPIMLLSDGRAHIVQVKPGLRPYFWICSRGWFRPPRSFGMVITNGLDAKKLERAFGKPQRLERCGDYEVFLYDGAARARVTFGMTAAIDRELPRADAERRTGW